MKRSLLLVLATATFFSCKTSAPQGSSVKADVPRFGAKADPSAQFVGFNFDWDDNIFNMPTRIMIWNKKLGREVGFSTAEWALVRQKVGKAITPTPEDEKLIQEKLGQADTWEGFEMRADALRNFGDDDGQNHFLNDVERGMQGSGWEGPSWEAFVEATSRVETAAETTIITARLQSPKTIHQALERLQQKGVILYVPPEENIYPVAYPGIAPRYRASASSPSEAKAVVMTDLLDKVQARPFGATAQAVVDQNNKGSKILHLWGFSDDDWGNFSAAVTNLQKAMNANPVRWDKIKITVFFTGTNNSEHQPQVVVLTLPDGKGAPSGVRDLQSTELNERADLSWD